MIPPEYDHQPQDFFTNITGFYREANVHPVNLLSHPSDSHFFQYVHLLDLNTSAFNETRAEEMRGAVNWTGLTTWSMNLRERTIEGNYTDWTWIKGGATLGSADDSIEYSFYGLHHLPNGTYNLFARPDGVRIDFRDIPRLYPEHHNITSQIILVELEKELRGLQDNLMLSELKPDGELASVSRADGRPNGDDLSVAGLPYRTTPSARCVGRCCRVVRERASAPVWYRDESRETAGILGRVGIGWGRRGG